MQSAPNVLVSLGSSTAPAHLARQGGSSSLLAPCRPSCISARRRLPPALLPCCRQPGTAQAFYPTSPSVLAGCPTRSSWRLLVAASAATYNRRVCITSLAGLRRLQLAGFVVGACATRGFLVKGSAAQASGIQGRSSAFYHCPLR